MAKINEKLNRIQLQAEALQEQIIETVNDLGIYTNHFVSVHNLVIITIDTIRNIPIDKRDKFEQARYEKDKWLQSVKDIQMRFEKTNSQIAKTGGAGVATGVGIATLAPSAAMGIATAFGTASTGAAISSLSGAAATNAALAWLGGGTLAAGGGGMALGNVLLGLAGPVGWGLAATSIGVGVALSIKTNSDRQRLEDIYTLVGERDIQSYKLTLLELEERIHRLKEETRLLYQYHLEIKKFEHNYDMLSNSQKYALGMSINVLKSSVQLLINPLLGLQSNVPPEYFRKFVLLEDANNFGGLSIDEIYSHQDLIIYLANLLYDINLNDQDIKVFWKNLISNKENQENFNISKSIDGNKLMAVVTSLITSAKIENSQKN